MTQKKQRPRLELCRLAAETAVELGDPLRAAYAHCFVGNTLRTMGGFDEARATLRGASESCQENPWTAAFLALVEGDLEAQVGNRQLALDRLKTAEALYKRLDPHIVGIVLTAQGQLFFFEQEYETAQQLFEAAFSALDHRRDPVRANGAAPLNLAVALGAQGRSTEAKAVMGRCKFDRYIHLGGAATELFVTGCLALDEGGPEEALHCYREAEALFESLDRPRDKALTYSYSVEAYAHLGRRDQAIESAAKALQLFQALGCKQDTVEAFAKLRQQLAAAVLDGAAVAATVRRLARAQGGWLP